LSNPVTWTGMLAGESKWAALRLSEVFALPSHQENFGVAVVEALACGVPVLISTKVNIWREVLAEEAGIAEEDDQPGTDQLLARWMSLPPAIQLRMREKARRCFTKRFDVRDTATRLAVLLDRSA
jgi:glycosyltransferase involved in cell wall biosynthesis